MQRVVFMVIRTLAEIREDQRIAQWEINRDYKQSSRWSKIWMSTGKSGNWGECVSVYKNGEYGQNSFTHVGSGLPVSATSYSVSGLPTMYWPQGTITFCVSEDNGYNTA